MPKVKNYTIKKMIKLTPDQNKNWDPKQIRQFLDENKPTPNTENTANTEILALLKGLHQLMMEKFDSKLGVTLIPSEINLIQKIEELIK